MTLQSVSGDCDVICGDKVLSELHSLLCKDQTFSVVDTAVWNLHRDIFPRKPNIVLQGGEDIKSMEAASNLLSLLAESGVDRSYTIVGIGGGSLLDLVGFCAAVYMRGVE
ncbi:MAG: hypothetical protein D6808_04905, partial [Candidatus Dadabacteria bacterium]